MSDTMFIQKCQSYIDCHLQEAAPGSTKLRSSVQFPSITISRQTGAGGIEVANRLAVWLQARCPGPRAPWTVFHKNLVQRVLEDHKLPARLAQFMPEDQTSYIQDAVEELLGLHPPTWNLLRQTTETILQLAELGNVILVGRGANVITARLKHVFHLRLVGSLERRVDRIVEEFKITREAAKNFIRKEDAGRKRYLRRHFSKDIADPLLYHMTINTDVVPFDEVVEVVGPRVQQLCPG